MEWNKVKNNIVPDARYSGNVTDIESKPHTMWGDMYIGFRIGNHTEITYEMMEELGVTVSDLENAASKNILESGPVFSPLQGMLTALFAGVEEEEKEIIGTIIPEGKYVGTEPYVVSNQEKVMGANAICIAEVLEWIGNAMGGDFYILPSSVHEVLVISKSAMRDDPENLNAMVSTINQNEVRPEEWLANHAFLYMREAKAIRVVGNDDNHYGISEVRV